MRRQGERQQRTIRRAAEVAGTGLVTGAMVRLVFHPAPEDTGVVFVRTDLPDRPEVQAHVSQVTGTARRTILGQPPNQVELVEHVLAALAGLRIDNCLVELDAPEPPGLDGSAHGFVAALRDARAVFQTARREVWTVTEPVQASEGTATITLHPGPADCLRVSYLLDYGPRSPIAPQRHTQDVTTEGFQNGLAGCRTFVLAEEAEQLRRQGLGRNSTLSDLVVFGPHGPIGNRLRFADEPARHKALDVVGDLALFGHDLRGHVVAYRSGHALNIALVQRLTELRERCRPEGERLAA